MPVVRGKEMDSSFAKNREGMAELKKYKAIWIQRTKDFERQRKRGKHGERKNKRTFIKLDRYVKAPKGLLTTQCALTPGHSTVQFCQMPPVSPHYTKWCFHASAMAVWKSYSA